MTAVPPRPAAPDATAGDELRSAIAERDLLQQQLVHMTAERDGLTRKLRDVLAAGARDAEKVRRVEELAKRSFPTAYREAIHRALDGSS